MIKTTITSDSGFFMCKKSKHLYQKNQPNHTCYPIKQCYNTQIVTKYLKMSQPMITNQNPQHYQQRTIKDTISFDGIGLHSGKTVKMTFSPAPIDTGIQFLRSDLADAKPILARFDKITDTLMSSNLTNEDNQRIGTVEHLLSALACMGIDNLLISVSSSEIPIMDGSAINFIEYLEQVGIIEQLANKKFIQILRPVEVVVDDKIARFTPYQGFSLEFKIDFNHPAFLPEHDHIRIEFSQQNFKEQIAKARTFGFLKDIEYLKSKNLGLGGSMQNAIVVDENGVLNPEGLRFADEFVRHKVLDAVGDLYLAGHQILGAFYGYKSGHHLNNLLLKSVFSDPENFKIVTKYDKENMANMYIN